MALPEWIKKLPDGTRWGLNAFVVDPDLFYPELLGDLGVVKEKIDQYWLEVALGCMKLDFDFHVRMAKAVVPGVRIIRLVRADGGRKGRWNRTLFPKGKLDFDLIGLRQRSREIRENYKRIRGFLPS